ncbi:MAG: TonB family protein [Candidatus Eisenbacteria bacterium]|nr:TonB family protein [Candidatus Eisenbacteria bacterium]
MPNEGHIGGFAIRRFIQKFMLIGLAISVGVHVVAVSSYYITLYIENRKVPPPSHVIYLDPSNLGQPPTLSGEELAPSLRIAQPKLAAAAIPKPVAAEVAPEEPQIQSQEELSKMLNARVDSLARLGAGENIQIRGEIPNENEIPGSDVFIAFEQPPQLVKRVQPVYPEMARQAAVGGKVIVQFYVDKKGDVKQAKIIKADPKGLGFEEAATEAVMKWKFTPALQRETPVGVWVAQTISFTVE